MDCVREPNPVKRGDKQAPATVRRDKHHARVIITLDVKISQEVINEAPGYLTEGVDVLRKMLGGMNGRISFLKLQSLLESNGIEIVDEKFEATK